MRSQQSSPHRRKWTGYKSTGESQNNNSVRLQLEEKGLKETDTVLVIRLVQKKPFDANNKM